VLEYNLCAKRIELIEAIEMTCIVRKVTGNAGVESEEYWAAACGIFYTSAIPCARTLQETVVSQLSESPDEYSASVVEFSLHRRSVQWLPTRSISTLHKWQALCYWTAGATTGN